MFMVGFACQTVRYPVGVRILIRYIVIITIHLRSFLISNSAMVVINILGYLFKEYKTEIHYV